MNGLLKRAHAFWWKDLDRWIVPAQQHSASLPNGWLLVRIGDLVKQVTEKVRVEPNREYKLAGVRWYGEGVFHRETVTGANSSATYLMPLMPGTLIYNRLFAWKESFAVVPEELVGCLVSNEFPQFLVNRDRLLPHYLYLFCMCKNTIKAVNKASIGSAAVSRNRFKEEYFLNIQIPLPPLPVQQAIVDHWQQAQSEIATARDNIDSLETELPVFIHNKLGIAPAHLQKRPKAFALNWSQIERWGFDMCLRSMNAPAVSIFPKALIKDICRMGSGGTPSRNMPAYYIDGEIPWVKTTEVKNDIITVTEEKITSVALINSAAKLYPSGSLIIAMYGQGVTRGRTAKLGIEASTNQACCVLYDFAPSIEPDFLWFYLMAEYENLRGLASGNNQPNLNAELIANYEIPLPPLPVQQEIVQKVKEMRTEIARIREAAEKQALESKAAVEAMILGTKKIPK
jgi:type I restriction enzyme, S subunit